MAIPLSRPNLPLQSIVSDLRRGAISVISAGPSAGGSVICPRVAVQKSASSFGWVVMRLSEPKPHWIKKLLVSFRCRDTRPGGVEDERGWRDIQGRNCEARASGRAAAPLRRIFAGPDAYSRRRPVGDDSLYGAGLRKRRRSMARRLPVVLPRVLRGRRRGAGAPGDPRRRRARTFSLAVVRRR